MKRFAAFLTVFCGIAIGIVYGPATGFVCTWLMSVPLMPGSWSSCLFVDAAVTAGNVKVSKLALVKWGIAAGAITRGQPVYYSPGDSGFKQANVTAMGGNPLAGVALADVGVGQQFRYVFKDPNFQTGATLASGDTVWVSATGITKTAADLVSTWAIWVLGVANADFTLNLDIVGGGVK